MYVCAYACTADWLLYDDDAVKRIKESEIVDSTAYLLFYIQTPGQGAT